ncbi:fructose/tagatose bisphosphate aldolase [Bacillus sp. V2I10]|nr:fructose/tagatose bisphosphate aldolase [Bacillus sp. V2I10]
MDIPLVLHGGSGISEKDFRTCITRGIRKINVATSTFNHVIDMVNGEVPLAPFHNYFTYHERIIVAAAENVKRHMRMFQSAGRALNRRRNCTCMKN